MKVQRKESSFLPNEALDLINGHFKFHFKEIDFFFNRYHQVCALNNNEILERVRNQVKIDKPKSLLFSLGSSTLLEGIYCQVAEELSVPIHFFKHSGIENFFLADSFLDNYFEKDRHIKRKQYFHSPVEASHLRHLNNISPYCISPLENFFVEATTTTRAILYSVGPSSTWSLKDIHKITLDSERVPFIQSLISYARESSIPLHIKIHPADWENSYEFFNYYLKDPKLKLKVLTGGSIERILNKYEVIVLDMISTKVLNTALRANKKTLLFKPNGVKINPSTFLELSKRVEVVDNPKNTSLALERLFKANYDIDGKAKIFNTAYFNAPSKTESFELVWKNLDL